MDHSLREMVAAGCPSRQSCAVTMNMSNMISSDAAGLLSLPVASSVQSPLAALAQQLDLAQGAT
jgi:hypothetical protein